MPAAPHVCRRRDILLCEHRDAPFTPTMLFESGLGILNHDVVGDGDRWVVQAYLLSCIYLELVSKRNASWMHLGVAGGRYLFLIG
jgi:hypothetical protein